MALITCSACGKQISPNASACPGCGEPVKRKPRNRALAILLYGLSILCLVGGLATSAILYTLDIPENAPRVLLIICVCVTSLLAVIGNIFSRPAKI